MKLTGADILVECLLEQKVDTIFGYPGGTILNIYDSLYKYKDKIRHYLTSHEQGAAHAADGYARASGKVGVCFATSGPGATNLVTGIATAYMDSIPLVAITVNVAKQFLGKDSFQEIDITGVTLPITKHNFIVKDVADLANTVRRAFYIAKEGRPGPVLIDLTKDVTASLFEYEAAEPRSIEPHVSDISEKSLQDAAKLMGESKRPLILAGGGVIASGAEVELMEFVKRVDAPITLSTMALGGFPTSNKYFIGMIGMHGARASNLASQECDLIIALGVRFADRVTGNLARFAPNAKILHVDIDEAEINKNVVVNTSITGDLKEVLKRLNERMEQLRHPNWIERVDSLKAKHPIRSGNGGDLRPQYVLEKISELTKGDAIVATDVGQHQMWACQYIRHEKPRHFITSGGLGTMGFGMGAAIGAKLAKPDKVVFNITGDGCFRMNNIELAPSVFYDVPVIVVIMNNHALGMVRQWQNIFYGQRYSATNLDRPPDFIKLAEAYGAVAFNLTKDAEVEEVLKKAISLNKTVVINCEIGMDEKVFPMVPAGAGIDEFVLEDEV